MALVWRLARLVLVLAWRFTIGFPLTGRMRTDATFFLPGTKVIDHRVSWGDLKPTRWAYLPGWKRALIRLTSVVVLVAAWLWPWQTAVTVVVLAAAFVRWRWPHWRRRRHERTTVLPLAVALAAQLGLPAPAGRVEWLTVPLDYKTNREAIVTLELPPHFEANPRQQAAINALITARLGGRWDAHWRTEELRASWSRPPETPKEVAYERSRDEFKITIGRTMRGQPFRINVGQEAPNVLVTAAPGSGKTSLLRVFITHALEHGWLVDIIDPKRRSFLTAYKGVPTVRLHTDIESMILAVEDFYLSMDGANAAAERGELDPDKMPRRLLVIDEMTSFVDYARNHYRRSGGKGDVPFTLQFQYLAVQGRQAEHRMVVAPHQPDAKVFGGTAVRTSFAARVVMGAMTRTLWMTAFGYQQQVPYESHVKGRAMAGLGEGVPEEVQLAWLSEAEARTAALAAAEPPEWFQRGLLPPWVTAETIEQARQVAGVGWLSPPEQRLSLPGTTVPDVPVRVPSQDRPESINGDGRPSLTVITGGGSEPLSEEPAPPAEPPGEPLIVGLAAAAAYLGYEKPDSFKKARARAKAAGNPIPGETRTKDGQPAFTPAGLRAWHSQRKLAGARAIPGGVSK